MKNILPLFLLFLSQQLFAQIGINNDGSAPNATAQLDVKSTTKGFLMPRMTAAERNAILSPAVGLQVYQTDGVTGIYFYSISGWNLLFVNNIWQ